MIDVIFNDGGLRSELSAVAARVRKPSALLKVLGRRVAIELKAHFRTRNRTINKLQGRRTNFWRAVADSVNSPTVEGSTQVRVSISHPAFAQKVFGGVIRPKRKRALTIPVHQAAYGRSVSVFENETGIKLFRLKKRGGVLTNLLLGEYGGGVEVFYVLARSVRQAPDPHALPDRAALTGIIAAEARSYLDRDLIRRLKK